MSKRAKIILIIIAIFFIAALIWFGKKNKKSIVEYETETPFKTTIVKKTVATGKVTPLEEIEIKPNENAGSLHDTLMNIGSHLVLKTVVSIKNKDVKTTPQKETNNIKTAYKLNKDNCKINWNDSIDNIYNHIRGLSPYPAAWCTLINNEDELDLKLYKVEKEIINHNLKTGTIVSSKKELKVAVTNGYIIIKDIKLPGKRAMDIKSLLNGYSFHENAKVL